jgi:hypothetical protein
LHCTPNRPAEKWGGFFCAELPLRLYCFRAPQQIVVLLHGEVKNAATAQASKSLRMKFYEARRFAEKIRKALRHGASEISQCVRHLTSLIQTTDIHI